MSFDQSSITEIFPPRVRHGQVFVSWTSSAAAGTPFQVYLDRGLAWWGTGRSCWLPVPGGPVRIDIGAVDPGQESIDFTRTIGFGSGGFGVGPFALVDSVPASPARRARLAWSGGYYLGASLAGFHVYGETTPGGGINYATPLATITAYPQGIDTSGFGVGAFGSGGFGTVAGSYSWESEPLAAGAWSFAVRSFDRAGNEGTPQTTVVAISAPPREPGLLADGLTRLVYSLAGYGSGGFGGGPSFGDGGFGDGSFGGGYPFGLGAITLTWNASAS